MLTKQQIESYPDMIPNGDGTTYRDMRPLKAQAILYAESQCEHQKVYDTHHIIIQAGQEWICELCGAVGFETHLVESEAYQKAREKHNYPARFGESEERT
jgi:hypothetical protein